MSSASTAERKQQLLSRAVSILRELGMRNEDIASTVRAAKSSSGHFVWVPNNEDVAVSETKVPSLNTLPFLAQEPVPKLPKSTPTPFAFPFLRDAGKEGPTCFDDRLKFLQFAIDPNRPQDLCLAKFEEMSENEIHSFWHCASSSGLFNMAIHQHDPHDEGLTFTIPFGRRQRDKKKRQGRSFQIGFRQMTPQELRQEMRRRLEEVAEASCVLFGYKVYNLGDDQTKYSRDFMLDAMRRLAQDAINRLAPSRGSSGNAFGEDIIVLLCYISRRPIYVVRDGGEGVGLEVTNYRAMVDQLVAKATKDHGLWFPKDSFSPWVDEEPFMVYHYNKDDPTNPDAEKNAFGLLTPPTSKDSDFQRQYFRNTGAAPFKFGLQPDFAKQMVAHILKTKPVFLGGREWLNAHMG